MLLSRSGTRYRVARLTLTLLMMLAWCGVLRPASAQDAGAGGGTNIAESERRQRQFVKVLQQMFQIGQQELKRPGADPSDVPQRAMELGHDVERIFAFVRDEVRYEPYAGVLRGAQGTLLARAGNAADKCLLLQALLEAGGTKTRTVRGELPADRADALVNQYLQSDPLTGPLGNAEPARGGSDFLAYVAAATGMDEKALADSIEADRKQAQALDAEAWATVDRETPPLLQRLETAGVTLGRPFEEIRKELAARAAQHVWIEIANPADPAKWEALDPCFAGSPRGQSHAGGKPVTLGEADEHAVTLRLVYARTASGGKPEDKDLIHVRIPTRQAASEFTSLVINPADELPPASKLMAMSPQQLVKTMAAIKTYQPALRVGGKTHYGQVFDLKGNLFQVSPDGRVAGASKLSGAAGGLFGGGLAGGDDGTSKKDDDGPGTFRELAVVIETTAPGDPTPVRQRRTLLTAPESVGEHKRSPMITWDLLIQPGPISGKWAAYRSARTAVAAMAPLVAGASKDGAALSPADVNAIASVKPEPCPTVLLGLAVARQDALSRQLRDAKGALTALWDSPFVAIAERSFCTSGATGHACGRARIDIVDNALRFIPRRAGEPSAATVAATAALRQGVFDTAAEALALRSSLDAPGAPKLDAVYSPIDDFAAARGSGDPLGVFRVQSGKPPAVTELALAEPDRAWVAAYERPGRVLVAPTKALAPGAATGWWTIDPLTGQTLGRHGGGRGQALSEKAILTNLVGFAVCMFSPIYDAATGQVKDTKGGLKLSLAIIGCIAGMTFGWGGAFKSAENIALFWALAQGLFSAGDKLLS